MALFTRTAINYVIKESDVQLLGSTVSDGVLRALIPELLRVVEAGPRCQICARTAVCFGAYEGRTEPAYSCGDCCGHGNEDGWCCPLAELPARWNALETELVRVREDRQYDTSKLIGLEDERHHLTRRIAALEAEVERLKGLEWSARQSLTATAGMKDRAKALEEENARLRAELAVEKDVFFQWKRMSEESVPGKGLEAVREGERAAVVAALEDIRDSGAAAAIVAGFRGYSTDSAEHVKTYQALADFFRGGAHLTRSSSCTTPPSSPPTPPR